MKKLFAGLTLALTLMGCASLDTIKDSPVTAGIKKTFPAEYNAVSGATVAALSTLNIHVKSSQEQPRGLVILVSKPMSAFSWGEVGRIFVEKSKGA